MACNVTKHIVLTGIPGVGKTTLVKKCCDLLKESGISIQGFYTEEIREQRKRVGFDVITLDGQHAALARVNDSGNTVSGRKEPMVGQYVVKLASFENVAIPALLHKSGGGRPAGQVIVIDEVGKMEMFSPVFVRTVKQILHQNNVVVLATIPVPRGKPIPLVEEIRSHAQVKLIEVTRENRDHLLEEIKDAIVQSYRQCTG